MREAKALVGLQECLGLYEPSLLAVDVKMAGSGWRWFPWRQRQPEPAILTSSRYNTLYNAPILLEIMKDLGVVDFQDLLGTHAVSHRLFWKWNKPSHYFFSARQRARTCKHTNTILMYKKAFNKLHAAQRQFLRALNDLNRELTKSSFSPFLWVYFSSFLFGNDLIEEER